MIKQVSLLKHDQVPERLLTGLPVVTSKFPMNEERPEDMQVITSTITAIAIKLSSQSLKLERSYKYSNTYHK